MIKGSLAWRFADQPVAVMVDGETVDYEQAVVYDETTLVYATYDIPSISVEEMRVPIRREGFYRLVLQTAAGRVEVLRGIVESDTDEHGRTVRLWFHNRAVHNHTWEKESVLI